MVHHKIEERIPRLPTFLSESGNLGHGVHQVQTQMQILFQFHQASRVPNNGGWDGIAQAIESRNPHLEGQCKNLANYVESTGGGPDLISLNELNNFGTAQCIRRDLPHTIMGFIGRAKLKQFPMFVTQVVKSMLFSPDGFHREGSSTLVMQGGITDMVADKKKEAEGH